MKNTVMLINIVLLLLLLTDFVQADVILDTVEPGTIIQADPSAPPVLNDHCPQWIKERENMPACPRPGMPSIIPETYPVSAVVVSTRGGTVGKEFTQSFVEQVIRSSKADSMPLILLMGVPETQTEEIKMHINKLNISQALKDKAVAALRPIPHVPQFTWQQDYFESFVDPNTGQAVIRNVEGYDNNMSIESFQESTSSIVNTLKNCGVQSASPLKTAPRMRNGHGGGNIEGLPGGFCLLGDDDFQGNQWEAYANQFCGTNPDNKIKVPTYWLEVGHTDEIMKPIRNLNPKPGQCNFSIALSSPRKATELLRSNPDEPFTSMPMEGTVMNMCIKANELKLNKSRERRRRSPQRGEGISQLFYKLYRWMIPYAYAPVDPLWEHFVVLERERRERREEREKARREACQNTILKNSDVLMLLQNDTDYKKYNDVVQKEMDTLRITLRNNIKNRLGCTPDFIQTPDLFSGEITESPDGEITLDRKTGLSILPNSNNAVSINDHLIIPTPGGNTAFQEYMKNEYNKRKITARFVDTTEYSHSLMGNLHCVSHTIHTCRPVTTSQIRHNLTNQNRGTRR